MHRKYAIFCRVSVENALGGAELGAKGANAVLMPARFLNGLLSNMKTIPMLNICTPPPDI